MYAILRLVKRTTISLPDELEAALQRYRAEHEAQASVSAVAQAAIQEFLSRRGYGRPAKLKSFRITPAELGSGAADSSERHDAYFAEAARTS
jgi:Arc/MetJ-type ribon-helix-helix transcriptional regulator